MKFILSICFVLALLSFGWTQEPAPEEAARAAKIEALLDRLKFEKGQIELKGGLAKVNLPEGFRFLGPEDAEVVLTKLWGNPPGGARPLGLIVPVKSGTPKESMARRDSWAVVIEYGEDGYVKDNDASKINYDDLLKKMQEGTRAANKERAREGYPSVELIGWAAPPRYDAASNKLYWAKEIAFESEGAHTLNYNIRMLGRRGVLVLNAVAGMEQLDEIEKAAPAILSMVEFQEGHRYADFKSGDKVATYGLAALVTGGILAKAGFFKVLLVGLLAAKKFVVLGAIALFGFVKKFFGNREE
ncbi:MAG: Protein of unknown function rane [Chthoniobacteraceae bacterium]|nr:Protein of unknown function rane [Chthoniobacteraceae bacterium]